MDRCEIEKQIAMRDEQRRKHRQQQQQEGLQRGVEKAKFRIDLEGDQAAIWEVFQEDLDTLGQIKVRESDGLLAFEDWCRVHRLIRKYTDMSMWPSLRLLVFERRQCLQSAK